MTSTRRTSDEIKHQRPEEAAGSATQVLHNDKTHNFALYTLASREHGSLMCEGIFLWNQQAVLK